MNNPSPLTQNHKQLPGAAAQPAEPGPNPARRGTEPTVYIAHPTHVAGTRPNRTQLTTAARKTTLNAGQCVHEPREGRGRNRQAPPPPIKKKKTTEGGGGKGAKTAHSRQTARQHHQTRPNPPPEDTEDRTPKEAQGNHPAKTGNTKPGTAAHRERGHRNKQTHTTKKKKKEPAAQPERKGMGGQGPQSPGQGHPAKKKKRKNTPRQRSPEGLGTAETRSQHTRPHRTPEPETAGGKRGAHATTHVP